MSPDFNTLLLEQQLNRQISNLKKIMTQIDQQLLDLQPAKGHLYAQLRVFNEEQLPLPLAEPAKETQLEFQF